MVTLTQQQMVKVCHEVEVCQSMAYLLTCPRLCCLRFPHHLTKKPLYYKLDLVLQENIFQLSETNPWQQLCPGLDSAIIFTVSSRAFLDLICISSSVKGIAKFGSFQSKSFHNFHRVVEGLPWPCWHFLVTFRQRPCKLLEFLLFL